MGVAAVIGRNRASVQGLSGRGAAGEEIKPKRGKTKPKPSPNPEAVKRCCRGVGSGDAKLYNQFFFRIDADL